MTDFRSAHHSARAWRGAAAHCLGELGALGDGYRLGFLYVTDHWADAIGDIAAALARGPNLFGVDSHELRLVREALGEVPLVGFLANGEISHHRLYAYTGVLTPFL